MCLFSSTSSLSSDPFPLLYQTYQDPKHFPCGSCPFHFFSAKCLKSVIPDWIHAGSVPAVWKRRQGKQHKAPTSPHAVSQRLLSKSASLKRRGELSSSALCLFYCDAWPVGSELCHSKLFLQCSPLELCFLCRPALSNKAPLTLHGLLRLLHVQSLAASGSWRYGQRLLRPEPEICNLCHFSLHVNVKHF